MFNIRHSTENNFDKIILEDDNGTSAVIIPGCGAILHAFIIKRGNTSLNVIEGYESKDDFEKNLTSKGFRGCKLSPFVCRITKGEYVYNGKLYKIKKYYDRDNALHGLLYDQQFTLLDEEQDEDHASVSMRHEYRGSDPGYPFHYDCTVTYSLEKENSLVVTTEIFNRTKEPIPVQDGWHPYFTLGKKLDELQLSFLSNEVVEFNDNLIPTGELIPYKEFHQLKILGNKFFDNCFVVDFHMVSGSSPACILRDPVENIQIEICPDKSYPYLQFYTPPSRNSIAIENISGAPDAFNNGMGYNVLSPGESVNFKTCYKVRT